MTRRIPFFALIVLSSVISAAAPAAELPDSVQQDLQRYRAELDELHEEFRSAAADAREDLLEQLERDLHRETRRGHLDQALAIRELRQRIEQDPLPELQNEAVDDVGRGNGSDLSHQHEGLDLLASSSAPVASADGGDSALAPTAWREAMPAVHQKGKRYTERGVVMQLGDGFLLSRAVLSAMLQKEDGLPSEKPWQSLRDHLDRTALYKKGPEVGTDNNMLASDVRKRIDRLLLDQRPEFAVILLEDRNPKMLHESLERIVTACIDFGCVPILVTRPPRERLGNLVPRHNAEIRAIAQEYRCPLIDYHAAVLRRRPGETWLNTLIKPSGMPVHTGIRNHCDFSQRNLDNNGIALFNFLAARAFLELLQHFEKR